MIATLFPAEADLCTFGPICAGHYKSPCNSTWPPLMIVATNRIPYRITNVTVIARATEVNPQVAVDRWPPRNRADALLPLAMAPLENRKKLAS